MDSELPRCPNPEIAPEEWQHTPSSVQQMILQMAQRLAALEREVSMYAGPGCLEIGSKYS
jgi:hypothetical protein